MSKRNFATPSVRRDSSVASMFQVRSVSLFVMETVLSRPPSLEKTRSMIELPIANVVAVFLYA